MTTTVPSRRWDSWAAAPIALCGLLIGFGSPGRAQTPPLPRWSVAAGGGFVFRSVSNGSFGGHVRVARALPVAPAVYVEPSLTWHRYGSSDYGNDACPIEGCPPPRRDGVGLIGLEVGLAYRKAGASNLISPVIGLGLYRSTVQDTSEVRAGARVGLMLPFRRSGRGLGLEIYYVRMFDPSSYRSVLPVALRWSF